MCDTERLDKKFNTNCFTLSEEDIYSFNKNDKGPINNVIVGLAPHSYGVRLFDDEYGLTVEHFFVSNHDKLKGDIIRIEVKDEDYFQLLMRFCTLLSDDYFDVDAINAFKTFQSKLRSFLEKLGFFTITDNEIKPFKGKNAIMFSSAKRGVIKLDFIDKTEFYRDFFNNNYRHGLIENSEYVYLMLNADTSFIKIGTSKNPQYRERTLHSQEPDIHIIAKWKCNKNIEKELHHKYGSKRIRGEWFSLTFNDLMEIEKFMNEVSK